MRNYYIHILIWGISIIISSIFAIYKKDSIYNIAIVWGMCAIFFVLYYLMKFIGFMKFNKINLNYSRNSFFPKKQSMNQKKFHLASTNQFYS